MEVMRLPVKTVARGKLNKLGKLVVCGKRR